MREEIRTKTIEKKETFYVSFDDIEFYNEEECKKYEESACGMLLSKLMECEINRGNECDFFDGNDENQVRVLVPTCQKHLDIINQLYHMWYPKQLDDTFVTQKDLGMPILLFYNIYNDAIDCMWFKKLDAMISYITKDQFKLESVESVCNPKDNS